MTDLEKDKLSSMFNKYRRYSDISCTNLGMVMYECDSLDVIDRAPIINVDMKWLYPYIDGLVIVNDDPKKSDLTSLEVNLMIIEVLIYIRSYTENEDLGMPEVIEMFEDEMYKSMSMYGLVYKFNPNYNINTLEVVISMVTKELTTHDQMIVVGWVNNSAMILSVIEGL